MDELNRLLTRSEDKLNSGDFKAAYIFYLDTLDAASRELRRITFVGQVARPSKTTESLVLLTRNSVASIEGILAKFGSKPAVTSNSSNSSFRRKTSLTNHTERVRKGQALPVTKLTERYQAAAAAASGKAAPCATVKKSASSSSSRPETAAPEAVSESSGQESEPERELVLDPVTEESSASEPELTSAVSVSTAAAAPTHTETTTCSPDDTPTMSEEPTPASTPASTPSATPSATSPSSTAPTSPSITPTPSPAPAIETTSSMTPLPSSIAAPTTTLTAAAPVDTSTITTTTEEPHTGKAEPASPPVVISPHPHPLSTSISAPTKPLLRSSYSDNPMDTAHDSIDSPIQLLHRPNTPPEQNRHPMNSPSQMKQSSPLKPVRNRKEQGPLEDMSLDDESSDVDEDEDDAPQDPPIAHRKTSSPNIAIPTTPSFRRRRGPSTSEPASPSHSPRIPSSCPSSQGTTKSFPQSHYSHVRQSSSSLIAVIPEGCVDPTNLVEAKRINGDDEDKIDLKAYGPSDHLPNIPISPLRTTYRSLVEKEKSWSSTLADTRDKIQELQIAQSQRYGNYSGSHEYREADKEISILQEDACKCTTQINNTMATIIKVRELLYRSAGITSILEFPPYLVAYQLTLVESAIFLEIPHTAFLTHSPKTPHRAITASTDFFNYLTRMIEYSILFQADPSGRAQIMNHWIKVAVKLHELENFQTLKAILCALGTPPIKRLKRSWNFLPRKSISKVEVLSDLMSEDRNYGKYREMMSSLCAGTITSPNEVASPLHPPEYASTISGSRSESYLSLTPLEMRPKDVTRRPVVPFLGTFIMDMTYLLAAVKKNGSQGAATVPMSKIPATSSLRVKSLTVVTDIDPRIQDLLMTVSAYQSGPRYSPQPPRSYIKASTKTQNHFRAPSLSSALRRTTEYRNSNAADRDRQFIFDDEDDDLLGSTGIGSGGIRSTQQLILHYLLTRPWAPERMVDELSMMREPPKGDSTKGGWYIYTPSINSDTPYESSRPSSMDDDAS